MQYYAKHMKLVGGDTYGSLDALDIKIFVNTLKTDNMTSVPILNVYQQDI